MPSVSLTLKRSWIIHAMSPSQESGESCVTCSSTHWPFLTPASRSLELQVNKLFNCSACSISFIQASFGQVCLIISQLHCESALATSRSCDKKAKFSTPVFRLLFLFACLLPIEQRSLTCGGEAVSDLVVASVRERSMYLAV